MGETSTSPLSNTSTTYCSPRRRLTPPTRDLTSLAFVTWSPPLPRSPYIGVSAGVRASSLLLGQDGDEFAAEVGDVGDHTAPDQVKRGLGTSDHVSESLLGRPRIAPLSRLVCSQVCIVWLGVLCPTGLRLPARP
jgi:hypothetical protein